MLLIFSEFVQTESWIIHASYSLACRFFRPNQTRLLHRRCCVGLVCKKFCKVSAKITALARKRVQPRNRMRKNCTFDTVKVVLQVTGIHTENWEEVRTPSECTLTQTRHPLLLAQDRRLSSSSVFRSLHPGNFDSRSPYTQYLYTAY